MFDQYARRYRDDEEMYVYDQCCDNCANRNCPMELFEDGDRRNRTIKKKRKEDAIERDGEVNWCIYWKQKGRH